MYGFFDHIHSMGMGSCMWWGVSNRPMYGLMYGVAFLKFSYVWVFGFSKSAMYGLMYGLHFLKSAMYGLMYGLHILKSAYVT